MKPRVPIYIICFALFIAGVNIWLWYSPSTSSEGKEGSIPELNEQVLPVKNAKQDMQLSDDAEYPAPVKQLQQALAQGIRDNYLHEAVDAGEIEAASASVKENAEPAEKLEQLKQRLARLKQLVNEK